MTQNEITSRPDRREIADVLELVTRQAEEYLSRVDELPVLPKDKSPLDPLTGPLPETGEGAVTALRLMIDNGLSHSVASSGPRCFHFVIGGTTPAAMGADWITATIDQIAYAWVCSPLSAELELVSLKWLLDLFRLPQSWGGIMTTGATMANFVGLAAARQWWGERHDVDVADSGLSGLPRVPVLTSGYVHASSVKALAMLGIGRGSVNRLAGDDLGRLDIDALRAVLRDLDGAPAIVIGNAGEVNAGDFDPINAMADLCEEYDAWLHVDGAFGLFARVSDKTFDLAAGVERARSVCVDGHKWLNVPYDCGFGFVSDPTLMGRTFRYTADYLVDPDDPRPSLGTIGPESSRRARSLSVWATLKAYGRRGYREMVEGHLALAQSMARRVDDVSDLERLADVPLNIVCFRYNPGDIAEATLNEINERLGEAIIEDGRVYVGTTLYRGKTALRPAIVNWRTRESDIELFVAVVRELGARIAADICGE